MKTQAHVSKFILKTAMLAALAIAFIGTASAQSPDDAQQDEARTTYRVSMYGYLPSLSGTTAFPTPRGNDIEVDSDTLIDNLKLAVMGSFEVRRNRFGAFSDLMYFNVGGSSSGTRELAISGLQLPAGFTADLDLDVKATVWTLAGEYRLMSSKYVNVDGYAGTRLLDARLNLDRNFSADVGPFAGPDRAGSSEVKNSNWDAIGGVKGRVKLSERRGWFVPFSIDAGTGESDLTWEAIGGVGYQHKRWEVLAGWKHLDYDFKPGSKLASIDFNGPQIGVAYRW